MSFPPLRLFWLALPLAALAAGAQTFHHPGMLHRQADLQRMRDSVEAKIEPWSAGWKRLIDNPHSKSTYAANPADTVYRGTGSPENYSRLYNDAAAAYALGLRWHVSGDTAFARAGVQVLNAWSARLMKIDGSTDKFLAAGIYGYQMANAAELLRAYSGWRRDDFDRFKNMMLTVFYPLNHDFLARHNGACISHYWANWDLCNMASMIAIGILCDNRAIYDEAVEYFKNGAGNGSIKNAVWFLHPGGLGQWQESGRDQGHAQLGPALLGAFCEMAWNQGDDLYGYDDNRFLKGCEYVAKYNLGENVPYQPYATCDPVRQDTIAPAGRGGLRPAWELVYNHYVNRRGLSAPYCRAYAAKLRPEGGGGDYGPNSGGYDQLGYGTLTATLSGAAVSNARRPELQPALRRDWGEAATSLFFDARGRLRTYPETPPRRQSGSPLLSSGKNRISP